MEKKTITIALIWQNKPERYAYLSIVVLICLCIIAPFFPHLWLLWIALFLIVASVFIVLTWIITAREQEEIKTNGRRIR